ncbi:MAG: tetratricopeptide repeat protein, partial [Planctomycetes bacterium]|nr:tetratricopeptide repeat protein [Planctomycetota bacterium]
VGVIYVGLSEEDAAFDRLDQACEDRSDCIPWLQADPRLDPIRSDPRFDAVLRRAGFTPPERDDAGTAAPRTDKIVLAVLPFEGMSADPDTDYLKEEIPASIIHTLSRLSDLQVIPRSTAFRYDVGSKDTATIGRDLGATAVLTGQINARGDGLSIRAELVDVATNRQLWDERYNRKSADIIEVEEDIAKNISDALRLELTGEERRSLAKRDTENAEAYRSLLQGRFWWQKFTAAGWRKALGHFQDAVRIDPAYALAHAELSKAYGGLGIWFGDMPPDEAGPKARTEAIRAITLDSTLGEAHASLAFVRLFYDWDWSGAEEEFLRSISLAPKFGEVHILYGVLLRVTGRLRESEEMGKVAQQLDPTFPMNYVDLGETYAAMGRYEEGIAQCQKALDLDPQFPAAFQTLGYIYLAKGMYDESIFHLEKNSSLRNRGTGDLGPLGSAYALAGQRTSALAILDELRSVSSKGRGQAAAAKIHASLGNVDAAFASLEEAYRQRDPGLIFLNTSLQFAPLRSDPRYIDLARRMGFEPAKPLSSPSVKLPPDAEPDEKIRLAILPFDNRSGDPDARYLADEIPASIIDSLSMLSRLQVVPRSTAFRHRDRSDDVAAVGKLLNAYAVLTGQINTRGQELRIRAELIEVATGRQLWSQRYDQSLADTLAVETEITKRIADALQVQFGVTELARLKKRCPVNSEAHCKYLEGRFWWNKRSLANVRKSIKLFDEALSLDPQYALAHVGRADSYCTLGWAYERPSEVFPRAREAAEKALAIDPDLAEAYPAIGFVCLIYDWDAAGAKKAFDNAIALDPVYAN